MADYNEKPFETELCEHLYSNGWLYSANSKGYDKERALFPEDVFGWLEDTQPDEFAKVVKPDASAVDKAKAKAQVLDRIVKMLDTPMESGGGTLNLLRKGFKQVSARFDMCQFKPATTNNPATMDKYAKVRVRVMRQVYFSTADKRSVDLVLFINGLPVATLELKTDFTQSVQDAITQYKEKRQPKDPVTKHVEPLFGFGSRALVHFAVSNEEVYMTTKLDGQKTHFLPFNMGCDGGAGNPEDPNGSTTSYLWERVLERDAWLDIVGKFMHVEVKDDRDPITGKITKKTTLLFPRFHQWEIVTELVKAAREEGPGNRYLGQHSAGSGKTNSIAWLAHRLSTLHTDDNEKVFDSVIVVTDRTVLDSQLQDAIRQIDSKTGVVATITGDEAGRAGVGSKSALLAKTLVDGKLIIVVTIQTFPFAMQAIRETMGLKHKRFAVIADEAHSSQTGATANKLKAVLSAEELADLADGGEIDTEAVITAEMEDRAESQNVSYFAFTATPKAKTLELFGRRVGDGKPQPFHTYTMQQAIDEGFILDVLENYTSYNTAFQIAQNATDGKLKPAKAGQTPQADKDLVDQSVATKGLMRWVKLHPTNISQKVQIIVEHFRENVEHLLDGHAKAMVVTDSRKAAVRYKKAIDDYIAKKGYTEIGTLVAFSGDVEDDVTGPGPFNERTLNPGLRGRDLRTAFATSEYKVMLVANKFQTGFDQPLLCAMYVDKQLSGVTAVQTLSRLNRTYPSAGKDRTFVLDFVNKPEDILEAFKPYYRQAHLETETDPNLIHDLQAKLDQAGIYTDAEIDALVDAWVKGKGNNALDAAIAPAKNRFKQRYLVAVEQAHKAEQDALDLFRKDVGTFVRLYDFMSQIVNYGDTDLEKRSIFFRLLERRIRTDAATQEVDLSQVVLKNIKQVDKGTAALDLRNGEKIGLKGVTGAGSKAKRDPKLVLLEEVLNRLNDLFGDEDFSEAQKQSWLEGLLGRLMENDTLTTQATTNSKSQFLESPDLSNSVVVAVMDNQTSHHKMAEIATGGGKLQAVLIEGLGELVHAFANDRVA